MIKIFILIKNGVVFNPEYMGKKDILISHGKIALIDNEINISGIDYETFDAEGKYIFPGFIDNHVHIIGGGGEGGYKTRTPEIFLSDLIDGGITTVIGCLGTDATTRTMTNLIAKCKALNEEGITSYILTGSYEIPVKTLSGSIRNDLIFFSEIIGTGEIAISDHRSSHPTYDELMKLASESRLGGILSSKSGVVNIHVGGGKSNFDLLIEVAEKSEIPIKQFLPTHCNRNEVVFNKAVEFLKKGGNIDFTTSSSKPKENSCGTAIKFIYDNKLNMNSVSLSSDGQGSLPSFNEKGELKGLKVGSVKSLYEIVRKTILNYNIPIPEALKTITKNPANIYKLHNKGIIFENNDADLIIVDKHELKINSVISKGVFMKKNNENIVKGTFEN